MYDAGIMKICKLTNVAQAGLMPKEALRVECTAYYEEQNVGVTRSYAARSVNEQIDMLALCRNVTIPYDCKYAIAEDGTQYVIEIKQKRQDDVLLTLVRLGEFYDVDYAE